MKGIVYNGTTTELVDGLTLRAPGPREVVVQVAAAGLCHSDISYMSGMYPVPSPGVCGHEAAGVVASGPRAGVRVAIDPSVPCERCATCARGLGHLCPDVRFLGYGTSDGAMREVLAWPEAQLVPLPDTIDDVEGAMLEPLGVAIHEAITPEQYIIFIV